MDFDGFNASIYLTFFNNAVASSVSKLRLGPWPTFEPKTTENHFSGSMSGAPNVARDHADGAG